jgi:hypothetical protein
VYVSAAPPPTSTQIEPASQRSHWYAKTIGRELAQLPVVAVSVTPSRAVPDTDGAVMLKGGAGRTGRVGFETTVLEPAAFSVVIATRSVESMSPAATR